MLTMHEFFSHGITLPKKSVSVTPYEESTSAKIMAYYCIAPIFDFDCSTVAQCCGQCSMLKEVYSEILRETLDEKSWEDLSHLVEESRLFCCPNDTSADEIHSASEHKKCTHCRKEARRAVNEIYRYFYALQDHLSREANRLRKENQAE